MPQYYIKPIVWNTKGYKNPSGVNFTSGWPKDHGFAFEEWNNSPDLIIGRNREFRVFHTNGEFGIQPIDDFPEDIFVFMIASHDGKQYLVGVAGGATSLISKPRERQRLVDKHKLGSIIWQNNCWAIQNVQNCHGNDRVQFREFWNNSRRGIPNWKCPANLFLWLKDPLIFDAIKISGNQRLIGMYSSYQGIGRKTALDILNSINQPNDVDIIDNLKSRCTDELDKQTDITEIQKSDRYGETTKKTLIDARLGQGRFRADLMQIWNNSCAVTGCTVLKVLKASHIKPWRDSTNNQRLDPNNGLLLTANLDALFDSGLISFRNTGEMIISRQLPTMERRRLGIPQPLRMVPNAAQCRYLTHHRSTRIP